MPQLVYAKVVGARGLLGRWETAKLATTAVMAAEAEALSHQVLDSYREAVPFNAERAGEHFRDTLEVSVKPHTGGFAMELRTSRPDVRRWMAEGTGVFGPTGTRITPKNGPVLAFVWPGHSDRGDGMVFFRSVAGMQPIEWEKAAVDHARPLISALGGKIGARVAHVLAHGD
jgi:hypothetical protein